MCFESYDKLTMAYKATEEITHRGKKYYVRYPDR